LPALLPPPPDAHPPTPPGATIVLQPQVVITLVASGTVDDYDDGKRANLREGFAAEMGVAADDVALTIEAASVLVRFDVDVSSEEAGAQLVTSLSARLSSASAASSLLGIEVESTPTLEAVVTRIVLQPPPSMPPSGGGGSVMLGAIAGGAGVTLLLLLLVLACGYRRRHGKSVQACAPCQSTAISMPSQGQKTTQQV